MNIIFSLAGLLLFQFLFCNQALEFPQASPLPDSLQNQKRNNTGSANLVFKSTDDGQTWQDISKGLPENLMEDGIPGNSFFAHDKGLFLRVENGLYQSAANATDPFWTKSFFLDELNNLDPARSGILTYNYWGANLKKTNGTSVWSPIFDSSSEPRLRSVFETAGGTIFIGTDKGFFKTSNSGKTWKHVYDGGWAGNFAESNGVLVSTSKRRIIRSTDNGENWTLVISDNSVVWDVKQIKGGFAAITSSSESGTRILRTSYDDGITWKPTDAGFQDKAVIDLIWRTWDNRPHVQALQTSITQVGENFFCTHPDGIFKSSDKGKTWKLLLPSIEGKVFNLCVSGKVIYAIPSNGGC